jgi:hypothetical protein
MYGSLATKRNFMEQIRNIEFSKIGSKNNLFVLLKELTFFLCFQKVNEKMKNYSSLFSRVIFTPFGNNHLLNDKICMLPNRYRSILVFDFNFAG